MVYGVVWGCSRGEGRGKGEGGGVVDVIHDLEEKERKGSWAHPYA